jgi:predicted nucleotidyltransferase
MGVPKDIIRDNWVLQSQNTIIQAWRGSMVHGTYRDPDDPNSVDDKDVMGICVPPLDYYLGISPYQMSKGTKEIKKNEWDIVCYELSKAIRLLAKGNPNILNLLWLRSNDYLYVSSAGAYLLENRDVFTGRHVYHSFTGYAHSQLHKMEKFNYEGFMGAKRKALVDKHGYDTKNASHLIRLLRMGIEFIRDGELNVWRQDRQQLLDIRVIRLRDIADVPPRLVQYNRARFQVPPWHLFPLLALRLLNRQQAMRDIPVSA